MPVGTIIRDENGSIVGDLEREGLMFVAARGGAGGKGNHFFITDTEQAPKICEYGANGEKIKYTVEMSSMAHIGLVSVSKELLLNNHHTKLILTANISKKLFSIHKISALQTNQLKL